jgi:hypothetical protein
MIQVIEQGARITKNNLKPVAVYLFQYILDSNEFSVSETGYVSFLMCLPPLT